jgi:hypothetical protein
MNWFDILKNAGLAQSQRQGISARQKDEDFIFEDDDDDCKTWFETLVNMINDFFDELINEGEYASLHHWAFRPDDSDEIYCKIKETIQTKTSGYDYDLSDKYSLFLDFYDVDHFNIIISLQDKTYKHHPYAEASGYWYKDRSKSRQELIEDNNRGIEFVKKLERHIGPNALTKEMIDSAKDFESFINQKPHKWFNEDGSPRED